jgi:hypothetical protein
MDGRGNRFMLCAADVPSMQKMHNLAKPISHGKMGASTTFL